MKMMKKYIYCKEGLRIWKGFKSQRLIKILIILISLQNLIKKKKVKIKVLLVKVQIKVNQINKSSL